MPAPARMPQKLLDFWDKHSRRRKGNPLGSGIPKSNRQKTIFASKTHPGTARSRPFTAGWHGEQAALRLKHPSGCVSSSRCQKFGTSKIKRSIDGKLVLTHSYSAISASGWWSRKSFRPAESVRSKTGRRIHSEGMVEPDGIEPTT